MRKALTVLAGVVAVLLVFLAWQSFSPRQTPAGQAPLALFDLASFEQQFNATKGVRVVALLSPT